MDDVMNILDGKSDKPWNNIHNASMHMMLPWSNEQLKTHIAAEMEIEKWNLCTPKEIGSMLEVWFTSLDNDNLKNCKDLEGVLVPKAGQHRSAAILRWVRRKDITTATWHAGCVWNKLPNELLAFGGAASLQISEWLHPRPGQHYTYYSVVRPSL